MLVYAPGRADRSRRESERSTDRRAESVHANLSLGQVFGTIYCLSPGFSTVFKGEALYLRQLPQSVRPYLKQ